MAGWAGRIRATLSVAAEAVAAGGPAAAAAAAACPQNDLCSSAARSCCWRWDGDWDCNDAYSYSIAAYDFGEVRALT
jgi:hypothetical protein